jgi:hypothetical protein
MTKKVSFSTFTTWLLLAGIVCLAFVVRLKGITNPVADWHSWRQADTASVTREYIKGNYPLLEPRYHDLSNIPSGKENLEGYRMVEFPLVNYGLAIILKMFPSFDLVVTSRLSSILFSLITLVALFAIVRKTGGDAPTALLAAFFVAVVPYSIFYSRVILPEPAMLMAQTVTVLALVYWLDHAQKYTLVSWLLFVNLWLWLMVSLLLKPTAIFGVIVLVAVIWHRLGIVGALKNWRLWLLPTALIPMVAWWQWIKQFPEGIPASAWLYNGNGIRLKPAWWRWLFSERLGTLILGKWGTSLVVVGALWRSTTDRLSLFDVLSLSWMASAVVYMIVLATGNVQHDYYQVYLIVPICLLLARGVMAIWTLPSSRFYSLLKLPAIIGVVGMMLAFSWYDVSGYFNINNPALAIAGRAVDTQTPANAKVIAPYQGDTAFLFQTNRSGWPIGSSIDEKIKLGATHYVSTSYDDEARQLEARFAVVDKTKEYILIDLTTPTSSTAGVVTQ